MMIKPEIFTENTAIDAVFPNHRDYKQEVDSKLNNLLSLCDNNSLRSVITDAMFPGRRLRPTLLYWLCDVHPAKNDDPLLDLLAKAIELAHRASIITDDMLD